MNTIQVMGNTYCIDACNSYIPFYKLNEKDIILLDTGHIHEREIIESVIEENQYNIKGIINSHGHPDHVASNQYFKDKYDCPIAAPMYEAQICSSAINLKAYYNDNTLTEIKDKYGYMLFETDVYITDKQNEINFCGVEFKIMHTPGHSPSHICITTPDNVGYVADALITYEIIETAKIPFDFVLLKDLKSKDKLLSYGCDMYIVAHKGIYDDITNLIADNIAFYIHRAEKTYELIDGRMTMGEIVKQASIKFDVNLNNIYKYDLIRRMLQCHIDYLYETGKIRLVIDKGFRKYEKNVDYEGII
ncbi:MBL fold metallo-hydrolase [Sedimentibacter sp.]|uniref:MBL fold metallo-hydrolase n=1 Tax=Sedimentibacter sp. TaxID=1960295 RepID=UPI0028B219FF|nr:MBL fold metallo-hydrolase [Sedimentibacter sp.]